MVRPVSADAQAVARRLVHLAVHQRHLVEHAAFLHFMIEVVAFAGALADAGEHRVTGMLHRDVADQLHHVHGLAHAGAAEQADLAALGERADQVDHLDAGLEQLRARGLVFIGRRRTVDGHALFFSDRALFVDRVAEHVHDAAERLGADRHLNRRAGIGDRQAALDAVGGAHGDAAHHAVTELLLHLERESALDLERVIHLRQVLAREFRVDHGPDDLHDFSVTHLSSNYCRAS